MRLGLLCLAVVAGTPIGSTARAAGTQSRGKPNIIIFLCDDVGYGEFGFQSNREIPTPRIDSMARSGIRFTSGYVSAPLCSPARAGLMTGRYQTRFGHEFNGGTGAGGANFGLPLSEKTIADRLKDLGYATCAVGKWHLGGPPNYLPMKRGFDEFYGTVSNSPFFNPPYFVDSRVSDEIRPIQDDAFYTTDAYSGRAVDWIGRQRAKPFFLYLPFNAQHVPLQATDEYLNRFENIADKKRRKFAAIMSAMDHAVGKVMDKVREMGQEENTLVFFLSDNGGPTEFNTSTNDPLRGSKATTSEGGIRIPYCVQWKGVLPAGTVYDKSVIQLDILPTAIMAAGGKIDPAWKLDGVDLLPYLTKDHSATPHETLFWRFGTQWAIRKGDWKLVASKIDHNTPRLINLGKDIGEAHDLSAEQPDKVKELTADWQAWNKEQVPPLWGPTVDEPGGQPKRAAKKKRS